jgi:hypothetical protein
MDTVTEYSPPSPEIVTEQTLEPEKAREQLLLARQTYRRAFFQLYGVETNIGRGVYDYGLKPERPVTKEAVREIVSRRLAVLRASAADTRARLSAGQRKEGDNWYDETIEKQSVWLERALAELDGKRGGTKHLDELMRQLDKEAKADADHRAELIRSNSPSPFFSFLPGSFGKRKRAERELGLREADSFKGALLARADFVTAGYEQIKHDLSAPAGSAAPKGSPA